MIVHSSSISCQSQSSPLSHPSTLCHSTTQQKNATKKQTYASEYLRTQVRLTQASISPMLDQRTTNRQANQTSEADRSKDPTSFDANPVHRQLCTLRLHGIRRSRFKAERIHRWRVERLYAGADEAVEAGYHSQASASLARSCPEPHHRAAKEDAGNDGVQGTNAPIANQCRKEAARQVCGQHEDE